MKPEALRVFVGSASMFTSLLRAAHPMMRTFMFSVCGYTSQGFRGYIHDVPWIARNLRRHENPSLLMASISALQVQYRERDRY